jgi:hypothetical protein
MKKISFIQAAMTFIALIVGLAIGSVIGYHKADNEFAEYLIEYEDECNILGNYYDATESLLDDLNNEYDWVDAYDNYNYYDAKHSVDSLINIRFNEVYHNDEY